MNLDTLVAPLGADAFVRGHWPNRPYFSPDGDARLAGIASIAELDSVPTLIETSKRVHFFTPDGGVVHADHPLKLYRLGLTCYFSCTHVPALMAIAEELAAALGLPSGSMRCEAFSSEGDSGVAMHSDHDANFALLLRGRKRWRIAENHHIRNQTRLCRPSTQDPYDPQQLELADEVPFPTEMPADAETIDVAPGGLLFLPRGWWHETEATGECLQINFVVDRPMWLDVVTNGLRERLLHDAEWRALAHDVFGPPERRDAALDRFAELLARLRDVFDDTDPKKLAAQLITDAGLRPVDGATDAI